MERSLVRGIFDHPGLLDRRTENQLRYLLGFAHLTAFQPGAAASGARNDRPDVVLAEEPVTAIRGRVFEHLSGPLLQERDDAKGLVAARQALPRLLEPLRRSRRKLLEHHGNELSAEDLDNEIGIKTLVSIAGGGGGAGYVYVGAYDVLQDNGLVPGYVIGSSIGALMGLFRARKRHADFDEYLNLAKRLRSEEVFRFVSLRARYGLPGILRLFLHATIGKAFENEDGTPALLPQLEIPYEAVVAGVLRGALRQTPEEYARAHDLLPSKRPGPLKLRRMIAGQLVRMVAFFNPMIVKEIAIGSDELTSTFDAVDAAGFSAAVPGILHYDIARNDPHMDRILSELFRREEIVCLVDGGVANNVPVRTAWHQVQAGKIGTRNCFYLAFDCFHPQWNPSHVWLQPITRLVQLQVALNRPFSHRLIRFKPTLSPVNVLPQPREIDQAVAWGRHQMAEEVPFIKKFFERIHWVE